MEPWKQGSQSVAELGWGFVVASGRVSVIIFWGRVRSFPSGGLELWPPARLSSFIDVAFQTVRDLSLLYRLDAMSLGHQTVLFAFSPASGLLWLERSVFPLLPDPSLLRKTALHSVKVWNSLERSFSSAGHRSLQKLKSKPLRGFSLHSPDPPTTFSMLPPALGEDPWGRVDRQVEVCFVVGILRILTHHPVCMQLLKLDCFLLTYPIHGPFFALLLPC